MPVNVPDTLPAIELLKAENIFIMDEERATHQDIRPLKIVVLNLMPLKVTTETDLVRLLSNTPLQIELQLMQIGGYTPKNTPAEHMEAFYKDFDLIRHNKYDGMIITGAPVEHLPFEEVEYWPQMCEIFDWAERNVTSCFFICWAAQAGLFHYYNVPKYPLPAKQFGVFEHKAENPLLPICRGFDDVFFAPHSRHTTVNAGDIAKIPELELVSTSDDAGVYIVMGKNGRQFFVTGHSEYAPNTLDQEYQRDKLKGLDIAVPKNYYHEDNPEKGPFVRWKSHANLLFSNWLNYYVYQETPFNIEDIH